MRTFVSLFWQVTTLEAHSLSFFRRVCVTQGPRRAGVFKFSLYCDAVKMEEMNFKVSDKRLGLVSQNIYSL